MCEGCSCSCYQHKAHKKRQFISRAHATFVYDSVQAIADEIHALPQHPRLSRTQVEDDTSVHSFDYGVDNHDEYTIDSVSQSSQSTTTQLRVEEDGLQDVIPSGRLELDIALRYANAIIARDLLFTVYTGKLYCLPSPSASLGELAFDGSSAHVFVLRVSFLEGENELLFCTVCKTTRNSLAKELIRGDVCSRLRCFSDFEAQAGDPECLHVAALRIARVNLPQAPTSREKAGIADIPAGVQFGVTVQDWKTQVYASVQSDTDALDRALIQLHGENTWQCLKCTKTANCAHRNVWSSCLEQAHIDSTVEFEWINEGYDEGVDVEDRDNVWPSTHFPVTAQDQAVVRQRRGFESFCTFDPARLVPQQMYTPQCKCGMPFDMETWTVQCTGAVYGLLGSCELRVPQFHCSNHSCQRKLLFDGMFHGFLRTGAKTFMDMDLVNVIRLSLIAASSPLSSTYKVVQGLYAARDNEFCSRSLFVTSCWQILHW
jgi:hypothetical protein